jgi:hypothetical protein
MNTAFGWRRICGRQRTAQAGLVVLVLPALVTAPTNASTASAMQPVVTTAFPANVFQADQPLVFRLHGASGIAYQWRVTDWRGRPCAHGTIVPAAHTLVIPKLPLGYYELKLYAQGNRQRLAMVPFARIVNLSSRIANPHSPYDVDSAQSWLAAPGFRPPKLGTNPMQPSDAYQVVSNLEQLAGVSMIRDRMSWGPATNPKPTVFHWGRYAVNAQLLSRRGIHVLDVFQGSPSWDPWRRDGLKNLMGVYRFARAAGKHFAGKITAWECWNEEDGVPTITAWDFAAFQKAAYLGFKAGDPKVKVLNGPIANVDVSAQMIRVMLQNGMGDYFNVFSFHDYSQPREYPKQVALVHRILAHYGLQNKPIWVSESGFRYNTARGDRPPRVPGSGFYEMDARQARLQAQRVVKAQVTLHALGVKHVFFFVFPPYNEGDGHTVWGLLRWNWTVKPGYVALANLTEQLANSDYLGQSSFGHGVHAFLFRQQATISRMARQGTQTLVLWARHRQHITIHTDAARLERVNVVGSTRILLPGKNGKYRVMVGKSPIFINCLRGLKPSIPPARLKAAHTPPTDKNLTTVLRLQLGKGFQVVGNVGAELTNSAAAHARLDVYNFSAKPSTGIVANAGARFDVQGLPPRMTVPPMGCVRIPLEIRMRSKGVRSGHLLAAVDLKLSGRFNARVIEPVVVPFIPALNRLAAQFRVRTLALPAGRWHANASGKMQIEADPQQHAVRFHVVFPPDVDHWVYPYVNLHTPRESLAGSVGVSFQVKSGPTTAGFNAIFLMAVPANGKGWTDFPYRLSQHWRTVNVIWSTNGPPGFNPADVGTLRIGCNPRQKSFTYWIRDVKVYVPKKITINGRLGTGPK